MDIIIEFLLDTPIQYSLRQCIHLFDPHVFNKKWLVTRVGYEQITQTPIEIINESILCCDNVVHKKYALYQTSNVRIIGTNQMISLTRYNLLPLEHFHFHKKEGELRLYWNNGNLYVHCSYKNYMYHGKYLQYRTDGSLYIDCNYEFGKLKGQCVTYHSLTQPPTVNFYD